MWANPQRHSTQQEEDVLYGIAVILEAPWKKAPPPEVHYFTFAPSWHLSLRTAHKIKTWAGMQRQKGIWVLLSDGSLPEHVLLTSTKRSTTCTPPLKQYPLHSPHHTSTQSKLSHIK
mmetsp:Transcript_16300/g.44666  ORF Transcript_16300/g.44666 Transcript_16300/m.44666 type:complete len:117 (+) Transcript_16300:498-848(+)|eukprot:1161461-Pelagomonas_calceolata.AAC.6